MIAPILGPLSGGALMLAVCLLIFCLNLVVSLTDGERSPPRNAGRKAGMQGKTCGNMRDYVGGEMRECGKMRELAIIG